MIIMFLNFSGMGFFMHHLVPRASSYVLPAGAGCLWRADLEPGVILKQGGEPLTDHATCCAYDTSFEEMLHDKVPPKNVFE